ncbi:DUF4336 domain-containing protein [Thaumasiovibrio sp. DFM-14]|uniref:DUF4336 domain-containing protein n=1 Tax=Thaumasiovibrio sp. DFM-14 TaxID=3384792 RepID=UPI00399EEA08
MQEWCPGRVWFVDQALSCWGTPIGTRMTVIKLANEQLFIHSPVELTTELQLSLSKLGQIAFIVTPNHRHHLFLAEWWLAYRDAYFFSPPRLAQKRTDITFDDALGATTATQWKGELHQTLLRGNDLFEEVIFFDPQSKTLLLGDTLAWLHSRHPLTALVGLLNGCYTHPAMPYYLRHTFKNKRQLRQSIQEILSWPFERIILSHGQVIDSNAKHHFANAFKHILFHPQQGHD